MSTTYRHGVYTNEEPTSIIPSRSVSSNLPFVVGTAPVDTLESGAAVPANQVRMYTSQEAFAQEMGWSDDFSRHTLCEAVQAFFNIYTSTPMCVVNVFDPTKHVDENGNPDPTKVTAKDVIGGLDPTTLKRAGLELINEVFPRYRDIPSTIIAPKFSCQPEVAVMMAAKTQRINGLFQAIAIADIDPDQVPLYTDVPAHKENYGLVDSHLYVCWPKVKLGDQVYHISSHAAGIQQVTDYNAGGFPHVSPSNKKISITGVIGAGGENLWLGDEDTNPLNGQGVVTVSSFDGGYKLWGNRTSAYPSNTDPKDAFISVRRFMNWYQNTFILTYRQKVDEPLNRRQIQTFLDSEQIRLDGFTSRGIILGGRIEFLEKYNPTTDLIDGISRFKLSIMPPVPNRVIEAIFEIDPSYLQTLFD